MTQEPDNKSQTLDYATQTAPSASRFGKAARIAAWVGFLSPPTSMILALPFSMGRYGVHSEPFQYVLLAGLALVPPLAFLAGMILSLIAGSRPALVANVVGLVLIALFIFWQLFGV